MPVLGRLENDLYDWWEDATSFRRTLGTIRIDAQRLTLEIFSAERADAVADSSKALPARQCDIGPRPMKM